jgi:carboxyl-terminal processing protease
MSLKFRSILVLMLGTILGFALSVGSGVLADRESTENSLPWDEARLLAEVLERVRQEYVEPIDDQTLIESAVRGMVTDLDAHSQFLDVEEYEEIRISTTGNYSGVGLEVNMQDGAVSIVSPIDGTPAARAGLKSGDIILAVDGVEVDERNVNHTINRMRGKPGTKVNISIGREGEEDPIEYDLVRRHVHVNSVRSALLEPAYGYLRITHFSDTTYKDLRKALSELRDSSTSELQGLILDLRNNPGGVLDSAVDISDAFLDEGVIVTASGRGTGANFSHEARSGDLLDGGELVVVVNEGSASASEIVAGALQDNHRATIVGSKTFGKGSVQTVMPLSKGRAIKLTTSLYYTPSGDSIHGKGIIPDIVLEDGGLEDMLAGAHEFRTEGGEALLQTDAQLRQAFDILKSGRVIQSKAD